MDSMLRVAIDVTTVVVYIIIILFFPQSVDFILLLILSKLALATQLIHITVIHS